MSDVATALRPFLWLAAIAFLLGFVSYLAMGRSTTFESQVASESFPAQVSAPMSDDWNVPKHI